MQKRTIDFNADITTPEGEKVAEHLLAARNHFDNLFHNFAEEATDSDFVDECLEEFAALAELFERKNSQYGVNSPLANFRNGALLACGDADWPYMFKVAKSYCLKHVAHVFGAGQNIDDDKLDESLGDIAVYCIIMLYMVKKYKAECQQ